MAGALRKTMEYLGLAEADDHYDEYDDYADDRRAQQPAQEEHDDREERQPRSHGAEVTPLPRRTPVARVVKEPEVSELNRIDGLPVLRECA